jgi:hypothetical protein
VREDVVHLARDAGPLGDLGLDDPHRLLALGRQGPLVEGRDEGPALADRPPDGDADGKAEQPDDDVGQRDRLGLGRVDEGVRHAGEHPRHQDDRDLTPALPGRERDEGEDRGPDADRRDAGQHRRRECHGERPPATPQQQDGRAETEGEVDEEPVLAERRRDAAVVELRLHDAPDRQPEEEGEPEPPRLAPHVTPSGAGDPGQWHPASLGADPARRHTTKVCSCTPRQARP